MDKEASERSDQAYYQHRARQVFEMLKEGGTKILAREVLQKVLVLDIPKERDENIDTSNPSAELIFIVG